jgi:PAS domain S-box-containing protein
MRLQILEKMNSEQVFQKFQKNFQQIADFYQQSARLSEPNTDRQSELFEELCVAIEELQVAQEELLRQNHELEHTRAQVEAERQRYQDLFELAPDAYLVTDGAGIIEQANRTAAELLNVSQMRLVKKPLTIFIPASERTSFRSKLNQLVAQEKLSEWELRLVPRYEKPIDAAITVSNLYQEENGSWRWLWLIRDITERKQAEANLRRMEVAEASNHIFKQAIRDQQRLESILRESESRFRYIFEAVGVSIWEEDFSAVKTAINHLKEQGVQDLRQYFTEHPEFVAEAVNRTKVLNVNETTVQMFEAENKEQLMESLHRTFLPETLEIFTEELLALASGEAFFSGETVMQTLKGKNLNILFTITFFFSEESYEQVIVTLFDISDRKQAELLLQAQSEDLKKLNTILTHTTQLLSERNQELDRFVYIVSHDLKAPLRAITNLSTWIADDLAGQLNEDNLHQMNLLQDRVSRMEDLIDGLLVYSRVGRSEAMNQAVDLAELLDEILDSLDPPPTFTIVVPSHLPTINAKRLLLSQVFSNLISNAIKHHDRSDGRIEISVIAQEEDCKFAVTDDGPGIAPENHERVFDIFQTLKASSTKENTGIGLAIVKKILESEGGTIWIESQLGQGTAFYFTWPKNHH